MLGWFRLVFLLALIALLAAIPLSAQPTRTMERVGVSWNRYYLTWNFRPRWAFHQEVDYRFLTANGAWHQLITHTHVHRRLGEGADASLGFSRSEVGAVGVGKQPFPHRLEWRLFQELHLLQALGSRVRLQHRYRTEQRFFLDSPTTPFTWRGRYRIQAAWMLPGGHWTLKAADEVMVNWGRHVVLNAFDQNRIYAGAEYVFSARARAEVGYMGQWQQTSDGMTYFWRDIVRASIYHTL